MDNAQYLEGWQRLIMHGVHHPSLGLEPQVMELYRGFVWNHYETSLRKMFPRLKKAWPELDWRELAQEFFSEFPPSAWELNALAYQFPEFLQRQATLGRLSGALAELADYEVSEFQVFKGQIPPASEWRLNPTLKIHQFSFDIASWVKSMEQGVPSVGPQNVFNVLMIAQNPHTGTCVFTSCALLDVCVVEVFSQISIDDPTHEVVEGVRHLLPEEEQGKWSDIEIMQHFEFLKKQSIILAPDTN